MTDLLVFGFCLAFLAAIAIMPARDAWHRLHGRHRGDYSDREQVGADQLRRSRDASH